MNGTGKRLRDLFFLLIGTAILYHEVWLRPSPSPLGVFVALFLFGLIPAFRADEGPTGGPLSGLLQLLAALATKAPAAGQADPEARVDGEGSEPPAAPEGRVGEAAPEAPSESSPPKSRGPGSS